MHEVRAVQHCARHGHCTSLAVVVVVRRSAVEVVVADEVVNEEHLVGRGRLASPVRLAPLLPQSHVLL